MKITNNEGSQEEANEREIEGIVQVLTGLHDQLIFVADYMEERAVLTQEEVKRLDKVRHLIASKILIITK